MSNEYTVSRARANFKDVIDRAEDSLPVQINRGEREFLLMTKVLSVELLTSSDRVPRPEVIPEDGGWSIFLPGVPVAADALTFNDAVSGFVEDLREYTAEWLSRPEFRLAPNHWENMPLVHLVDALTDAELRSWVVGERPVNVGLERAAPAALVAHA